MKLHINKYETYTVFISVGFLFFPFYVRSMFFPFSFACLNILSGIGILFLINQKKVFEIPDEKWFLALLYIILLILFAKSYTDSMPDLTYAFSLILAWIFPLFIIFLNIKKEKVYFQIFKMWLRILNFVVYIITTGFIFERLFGIEVSGFFIELYSTTSLAMSADLLGGRLVSYLGHPLFTTEIILIYYIFNYIDGRLFGKQKYPIIYILISFLDIALLGGKVGIILITSIVLFHNFQNKKLRNVLIIVLLCAILYFMGVFDIIILRFVQGIRSGDLTSARSTSWNKLFVSGLYTIKMWTGQWVMDSTYTTLVAALEYPFLKWAFLIGSAFSLLLSFTLFVIPAIKVFITKQFNLLACLGVIILDVNTFNTITTQRDALFLYCWIVFLIINAARILSCDRGEII